MKKIALTFVFSCLMTGIMAQSDLTGVQKKFQNDIVTFLKKDGFSPSVNEDGEISFQNGEESYWIRIFSESPFFVVFQRSGYRLEDLDHNRALLACNEVNREMDAVKLYCSDDAVVLSIEQYAHAAEDFRRVFNKNLQTLAQSGVRFIEKYTGLSPDSPDEQASPYTEQFFPILGVTLGKTTSGELNGKGYFPQASNMGKFKCVINNYTFWDNDADNIYESIVLTLRNPMPDEWTGKYGFNWSLSYNEWVGMFKELGFSIVIFQNPKMDTHRRNRMLSAEFEAASADGLLKFRLKFGYSNKNGEGYDVDSKNSLYTMTVNAVKP